MILLQDSLLLPMLRLLAAWIGAILDHGNDERQILIHSLVGDWHRWVLGPDPPGSGKSTRITNGNLVVTEWGAAGPLGRKETGSGNQRSAAPHPPSFLASAV